MSKPLMVDARAIRKSFGSNEVLKGITLQVEQGQVLCLLGPSGSGKSTLLNILGILDEADSGNYILDKLPIKNLNETIASKYRNQFLGFVFQSFNLINYKSALDNVAMPLYYQGIKRKERNEIAMSFLEKVGLSSHSHHLPNELSGGQKQRVAIARALASNPKVLLADEPTGNLDTETADGVFDLMLEIARDQGTAFVIVTHDPVRAKRCDRILHLERGVLKPFSV